MEAGRLSKGALVIGWMIFVAVAMTLAPDLALAGDGTFTESGLPLGAASTQVATAIGDFNGDGDQDLANVGISDTTARVLLGGSGAAFGAAAGGDVAHNGISVVEGAFNSDNKADLAVANYDGAGGISILIGNGSGGFSRDHNLPGSFATGLVAGDFNGDDVTDLITTTSPAGQGNTMQIILFYGDGTGNFDGGRSIGQIPPNFFPRLATGDFDGDGRDDLAVLSTNDALTSNDLFIYRNQSTTTNLFWSNTADLPVGSNTNGIVVGDFNQDGDPDIGVTTQNSVALFAGGSVVSFTAQGTVPTVSKPNYLALGDFNSDGDDDLAVSSGSGLETYLGGAGFGFSSAPGSPYLPPSGTGGDLAIGDFDQDGNEDIVLDHNSSVSILTGGGTSWNAGNLLTRGGMEGVGAGLRDYPLAPAPWTGTMGYLRYDAHVGPTQIAAERWEGGTNFFFGGFVSGNSSLSQTVDVSSFASDIDAKKATANLSARLGGYRGQPDQMSVTATFFAADGTNLGSFQIGPVSAAARSSRSVLLRRVLSQAVPAQTRSITVRLDATQPTTDNTFRNYALADNVRLFVATPSTPDPTTPTPGPGGGGGDSADVTPPETEIDKGPKRRTEKAKAKIRYSASEAATFQCALKGGKKKLRQFTDCGETKAKYKHLKPGKKKFQVRAIDAAGNIDPTPAKLKWKVLR